MPPTLLFLLHQGGVGGSRERREKGEERIKRKRAMRQREDTVKRIAYKREERKKTEEKREETREEKLWKSRTN